jgi:hypothetical protein
MRRHGAQGHRQHRCGGAVTAHCYWPQVKQTLLRSVTDNLYRAVQRGLSVPLGAHRLSRLLSEVFGRAYPLELKSFSRVIFNKRQPLIGQGSLPRLIDCISVR